MNDCKFCVQIVARGEVWAYWNDFSEYGWYSDFWYNWNREEPWFYFDDLLEVPW